ncbi:MAG TPA: protein phosphatase 2C domain-containing protein [Candidatus Saccharimonadales bacterium]|nr:protein phosphatase 2C domain-containing protein [Candidatus Saccharimonadales bacterium]
MSQTAFELAGGSTVGRDHRLVPKNCQDGWYVVRDEFSTIAIVTDGCGSSPHSEVGALAGARLLATALQVELRQTGVVNWIRVRRHLLATLDILAQQMGGHYRRTIEDYFLFTVVGAILTDTQATFFACGDGVVIINGQVQTLGPFANNSPPYVGYGLIAEQLSDPALGEQGFDVVCELPLPELEHFVIGCDGVIDLIKAADLRRPGSDQSVGDISQFWQEYRYFANPELVSRELRLVARDWPKREPEPGLLPDDTTLIIGRRPIIQPEEA